MVVTSRVEIGVGLKNPEVSLDNDTVHWLHPREDRLRRRTKPVESVIHQLDIFFGWHFGKTPFLLCMMVMPIIAVENQ